MDYQSMHGDHATSSQAIKARLAHIVRFIGSLSSVAVTCDQVDEVWIRRFRTWAMKQPIVAPKGGERQRSRATVEASVLQLAAAINFAHRRRDTIHPAGFKPLPTREVSDTPRRRLSIAELADAFRYAADPKHKVKRAALHRFLQISTATATRPDAAHDFSTDPKREQWDTGRRVMAMNPTKRAQTKKYRATVIAPHQLVARLNERDGHYVGVASIRSAWNAMCTELRWPRDGISGSKIIRRSIAQLLRDRGVDEAELEVQLGHRRISSVTDLYAAFRPGYLASVTTAIEGIIDEVEAQAPGAFHRSFTGAAENVIELARVKK